MKQIVENKTIYRTATLFLKKENAGDVQDTVSLIESSRNRSAMLFDKFNQVFVKDNQSKKYEDTSNEVYEAVDTFIGDHNKTQNSSKVYGMNMRDWKKGDIIQVQEWAYNAEAMSVQGRVNRFFVIGDVDFDEFKFSTGEFL